MSTAVKLTADDFKRKSFKTAPGGTYFVRVTKDKTKIESKSGKGKQLTVHGKIMKGSSKGITFFDNIAAHVGWKIAQLLLAIGIRKAPKGLTLEKVLKLIAGKDLRAQLKEERWQGKKRNKVVTWLPLKKTKDEDDDDAEDQDDEEEDEDEESEDEEDQDEDEDSDSDEEDESDDEDEDDEEDSDEEEDDDESDSDDDEEEGDDEEDEEDEKPARKSSRKKVKKPARKTAKKKPRRSSDDDDDDEEE